MSKIIHTGKGYNITEDNGAIIIEGKDIAKLTLKVMPSVETISISTNLGVGYYEPRENGFCVKRKK